MYEHFGKKAHDVALREALPLNHDANIVTYDEGFTPLLPLHIDSRPVLFKQEYLFPTGSYKDRGASTLVSKIKELGVGSVIQDSSGNAGSAIAAYCARAGIHCHVFVPERTSNEKLAQMRSHGALVTRVPGSRQDAAAAPLREATHTYYASHTWNPFFLHGTKTFAFEVCEQLGWRAPDTVILPVGNGTLLLGAYIGFKELRAASLIKHVPRLIGVQAARCARLHAAFQNQRLKGTRPADGDTLAEGIAIENPVRSSQILSAVRSTRGEIITVEEEEIVDSSNYASHRGFYVEPTAAACLAGVKRYVARCPHEE
ncbi:MAG: threonine synthase [Bacteroidota bacterium]